MDYKAYSTTEGILLKSPRMLSQLSKVNKTDRQYAQVATILRCYVESPSAISGNGVAETDDELRNKAKYHSTYSLPNNSKNNSALGSAESRSMKRISSTDERQNTFYTDPYLVRSGKSNNIGHFPNIADRRIPHKTASKHSYSVITDSVQSARLPNYTDDYFDSLDIPGHFNTRGVYGQKAAMSPFTMRRTYSDLNLSVFQPRFVSLQRQATTLKWKLPPSGRNRYLHKTNCKVQPQEFSRKFQNHRRKSFKTGSSRTVAHMPSSEDNIKSNNSSKGQNVKDRNVINLNEKLDEVFDGVGALKVSEPIVNIKPKKLSVDVSVQTDIDTDEEYLFF